MIASVLSVPLVSRGIAWALALLASAACVAQPARLGPDLAGGKDLPWLSRFEGSQLIGFQEQGFGQGRFYLPSKEKDATKELNLEKPLIGEGKVTRLLYLAPIGKSPLEVHRNYEQALRASGFKAITSVDGSNAWWDFSTHWSANFKQLSFARPFAVDIPPFERNGFYLYGTLPRGGSEVLVSVLTGNVSVFTRGTYKAKEQDAMAAVAVQVIEPKAMQGGQVTVSSDALRKGLEADGKMALYGIYFDTGKAELKPESKLQLEQMAALLKQQAALRVYIVGHTDNQGAAETNLTLSQQRAQAVAAALAKDYGVEAKRLSAKGVASFAPLASNSTEDGRARNRRVELVVQ